MMDMKHLEYFVVACERKSLSKAAECLYTSQPNVSKIIRELEKELGRELLYRTGKGVYPTPYGQSVLEHARLILKTAATIGALATPGEKKRVRLSTYPSNMIARLLVEFYKVWGNEYCIEHHEGAVEDIAEQVQYGISEMGIVYVARRQVATFQHILSHKQLEFVPLACKNICLYVGPNHPLYDAESVDFSDLPKLRFVGGVRDFYSMEHHLAHVSMGAIDTKHLDHAVYTNSDHLAVDLLLYTDVCSLGIDFVHDPFAQYDIRTLPINGCEPFLQIGYVTTPKRRLSQQADWLIRHFHAML